MDPRIIIFMVVAIGFFYVIVPVALDAYFRFRGRRTVACPETGLAEGIEIDAWHAAATAVPGPPRIHVAACTAWPRRAGCGERCVAE